MYKKRVKNLFTGKEIEKPEPIDEEVPFDGGIMITETDRAGIITYANRKFREMTGYTKEEIIGAPHSINRHPDIPSEVFEGMWRTIKDGRYWEGCIKNLRKDGRHYWVVVWIKPKMNENGDIVGYIAGRKVPLREDIEVVERRYAQMRVDG
jgi:PAS domain S-box-containing protein